MFLFFHFSVRSAPVSTDLLFRDLPRRAPTEPAYASELVAAMLAAARQNGASDVHWIPVAGAFEVWWRIDGVLQQAARIPSEVGPRVVARLKVLAQLLTYQTEVPQEGRIRESIDEVEMRVSTFPTLFGEKAVVRLFVGSGEFRHLANLGLAPELLGDLQRLLNETSGAILISGPAGSGKTTTLYACLRELLREGLPRRNIVTLEDPIEAVVEGTSQSQVNPTAGFDIETGLRSLMRQDPEVMMLGEIRDRSTAEIAFQAALTGHLVLTTFHAASAAATISRLSDMGIEPYLLRSGVLAIINQRLVRRLCACSQPDDNPENRLGLPVEQHRRAVGCSECRHTGYRGRAVLSEMLVPEPDEIGRGILSRDDTARLEQLALAAGMVPRWQRAVQAVNAGVTTPAEVRRVLGFVRGEGHG